MSERKGGTAGPSPRFEAAINLLREELRAVADVRISIMRDRQLQADDPKHRADLLVQTLKEVGQFTRAIGVLERLESGELVEVEVNPQPLPVLGQMGAQRRVLKAGDDVPAGLS